MSVFLVLTPILLILVSVLATPSVAVDKRFPWFLLSSATLGSVFVDLVLLKLLPVLGLSFLSNIFLALFLFSLGRVFVLVLGLVILHFFSNNLAKVLIARVFVAFQVVLLLMAFYGMFIEPFFLTTTTLRINSPNFLQDRPLRIVQISDLHIERITKRDEAILSMVKALQPDIIVLTGDYMNIDYTRDEQTRRETRLVLEQLSAPMGIYAILGTPGVDLRDAMPALFNSLDIQLLNNELNLIDLPGGTLAIIGIDCCHQVKDAAALARLMKKVPPQTFSLLLYHTPDLVYAAAEEDVDLYLAGHTHGGQVRLPFYGALITFSEYGKAFEMGKYHLDTTTLYVSRGLGMEGLGLPRIRFLAPPELVLIELSSLKH